MPTLTLPRRDTHRLTAHDVNTQLLRVGGRPWLPDGIEAFVNGTATLLRDETGHRWTGDTTEALRRLQHLPTARGRNANQCAAIWEVFGV